MEKSPPPGDDFLYNRKLPQQKPFQGRMRSILVIAAAERRFFILFRKLPQQKPFQGRMRSILAIAAAERRFFIQEITGA